MRRDQYTTEENFFDLFSCNEYILPVTTLGENYLLKLGKNK